MHRRASRMLASPACGGTTGEDAMKRQDLDLVRGSIDTHAHTAPALFPRHIDDADLARLALEYGMRGFVLKDHDQTKFGRTHEEGHAPAC